MDWWKFFHAKPEHLWNRRRNLRYRLVRPLTVIVTSGEILGKVCEIGPGSCRLELLQPLASHGRLDFRLLPSAGLPGESRHTGKIRWVGQSQSIFQIGLDGLDSDCSLVKLYEQAARPDLPCRAADHRRHVRFDTLGLQSKVENLSSGTDMQADCKDIGLGGCLLQLVKGRARGGDFLRLTLSPPFGWFGVTSVGRVVRVEDTGEIGLAFSSRLGWRFQSLLVRLARSGCPPMNSQQEISWLDSETDTVACPSQKGTGSARLVQQTVARLLACPSNAFLVEAVATKSKLTRRKCNTTANQEQIP